MPKTQGTQTVLIIEDELDIQNFISRVLELEGFGILKAGDGENGLDMVRDNPVDLVILDMRLPNVDGWFVLNEIKQDEELKTIPIIVLTASADVEKRRRALKMGAAQYLVKPLSAHLLSRTVRLILGIKHPGNETPELHAVG